jgi:diadenosine tetraphosphate (Ap4A) HIT family hydrolase
MAAVAQVQVAQIRDFEIFPNDRNAKDFFLLKEGDQRNLLERINAHYQEMDAKYPAAGYKVRFVGSNTGTNSMEAHLYSINYRAQGSLMKMNEKPDCPFCKQETQMAHFEEPPESEARVIESKQKNVMVISKRHSPHFLENTVEEQLAMLRTAWKVIGSFSADGSYNYELVFHCGAGAHQKISHTHGHILLGTNVALSLLRDTVRVAV